MVPAAHLRSGRSAQTIAVADFRQIFHWPLSLRDPSDARRKIKDLRANLGAEWAERTAKDDGIAYEEAVYFHDFVQDFLYTRAEDQDARGHWHFDRTDIADLRVALPGDPVGDIEIGGTDFRIERLELDIFEFGVAIVTLEIVAKPDASLTLARVLDLIEYVRRAFPGFWKIENGVEQPGYCPQAVMLTRRSGKIPTRVLRPQPSSDARKALNANRVPELFPWWAEFARGLSFTSRRNGALEWRHVLDERIPAMSYIRLAPLPGEGVRAVFEQVSEADWHRIAEADSSGNSLKMPYNDRFLREKLPTAFYDRHAPGETFSSTTRITYAGHHHAFVGNGWFFENHIVHHFEGHYRRMHFIAILEFAAMLTFSRRITGIVRHATDGREPDAQDRLADRVHAARQDFLNFIHCYHFTHVSNHLQAREMNERLRASMGLDALRADVETELQNASDFVGMIEQRQMAQSQSDLTEFATLFLPATLGAGFGGMNFLAGLDTTNDTLATAVNGTAIAQLFCWGFVAYLLAALVLVWLPHSGDRPPAARARILDKLLSAAALLGLASGATWLLFG